MTSPSTCRAPLHGLAVDWLLTMMCKAAPFETLACMIDTDTVAVRHVSGSHQLGRFLLPIIM